VVLICLHARAAKHREVIRAAFVRPCAAVLLLAATSAVAATEAGTGKTLDRTQDAVVLSTARLDLLPGRATRDLHLMRVEHGQPVEVPFQFDQRDRKGDLVVDGPAEFTFDDNDELVFMAEDTGDRADRDLWPRTCDAVVEITVTDAQRNRRGWAYLLQCPGTTPPAAPTPYVVYDRATNQARSPYYEVDYAGTRNYLKGMRIGGGGAYGPNLLRQTTMRGSPTFSVLFTDVTLEFTEQTSIVAIDGIKNGPVRAVRRVRLSVDLGPLFPDLPSGTAYTYHYRTSLVTPTRFGIPGLALSILRDFHFETVVNFDPGALPLRYWDATTPTGIALDTVGPAPVATAVDHDWWAQSGSDGAVLYALLIPERWRKWGIVRGSIVRGGAAGLTLLNMTNLRQAGDYDLLQATIVLPHPFRPGDEDEPLAMLKHPLQTDVRRVR
jgi:hypothetical protein